MVDVSFSLHILQSFCWWNKLSSSMTKLVIFFVCLRAELINNFLHIKLKSISKIKKIDVS